MDSVCMSLLSFLHVYKCCRTIDKFIRNDIDAQTNERHNAYKRQSKKRGSFLIDKIVK